MSAGTLELPGYRKSQSALCFNTPQLKVEDRTLCAYNKELVLLRPRVLVIRALIMVSLGYLFEAKFLSTSRNINP